MPREHSLCLVQQAQLALDLVRSSVNFLFFLDATAFVLLKLRELG